VTLVHPSSSIRIRQSRLAFTGARALLLVAVLALSACSGPLHAQQGSIAAATPELAALPIVEIPAQGSDPATFAIFISGDGGWADLDQGVSKALAAHGIGVVGINSRAYLSHRKTPEQAAADVTRIARTYMDRWHATHVVLAGYSRGADMVPFIATRLPDDVRKRVALLVMLGIAPTANFQFHWIDIVRDVARRDDRPTRPELEKLRGERMLCVYGTGEKESGCRDADSTLITRVARNGGHHFDGNWPALADLILGMLPASAK
jgi:type IV secretory pathway VirJ component